MPLNNCKSFIVLASTIGLILISQTSANPQTPCQMVSTSQVSSVDQAKCLLRAVKIFGHPGSVLTSLPTPLDEILTKPTIDLDKATLRKYLQAKGIKEDDLGGSLDNPVSRANNNNPNAELARYFIIHDTSTPNFGSNPFPANINEASWNGNNLARWKQGTPLAHVFINRVGQSITIVNFKTPWRATKFEGQTVQRKGLFLNVEMIQPRRRSPQGGANNDALSPDPGFTTEQLDRLALVYIAASVRRGKWLIPAFHANVDIGVGDHDDPQNFKLEEWTERLNILLTEIQS